MKYVYYLGMELGMLNYDVMICGEVYLWNKLV